MPFTLIHGIIGYLVARSFSKDPKLLALGFTAGVLPDLDGLPLLWGNISLFQEWHHGILHSPFTGMVLGLIFVLILAYFFKSQKKEFPAKLAFAIFVLAFTAHPVTDIFSSDWEINFGFPFTEWNLSSTILGIPDFPIAVNPFPLLIYTYNDLIISLATLFGFAGLVWKDRKKRKGL
ncbi:MAG: metal-dependent hydrolase [Candidatus Diapherotrites archaeon]|nr:metal-dependent hydrolase [Candidatus Diapherotrites archaeon]